jgi:hypothetical protein
LLVGLAGTAVTLADRGTDTEFAHGQQSLAPVDPNRLAVLIATTSDPRPGSGHGHALSARCSPLGRGPLRNPWSCSVRYPPARRYAGSPSIDYRVLVSPDGSVQGVAPGALTVRGCCITTGANS